MYLHYAIPYTIVGVGSVLLLLAQLGPRFRAGSLWFRVAFLLASLSGITWSALGFFLLSHHAAGRTDLPWARFWALDHLKSDIAGVTLGIFIALLISPEFWRRCARITRNV
jgi:hypothetical protein